MNTILDEFQPELDIEDDILEQIHDQQELEKYIGKSSDRLDKVQLKLKNTTDQDSRELEFDIKPVIDSFMLDHPKFNHLFRFNGFWKPE